MTRMHFVANRCECRESVGVEVGPWEPATEGEERGGLGGLFKSGFEKPVYWSNRAVAESGAWCNDLEGRCHKGELR